MADKKAALKLDSRLASEGIVQNEFLADYPKVHSMLNTYLKKTGAALTDENFAVGEEKLRDWLMVLVKKNVPSERLTDYLRVGLAHLCHDFIESNNKELSLDDNIDRALKSFRARKYSRCVFKVSEKKALERIRMEKENAVSKKSADKKMPAKKDTAKKAAPKKIADKKTEAKKPAKKAAPKKVAVKKADAKKAAPKKVAVKKVAVKKVAPKKVVVKKIAPKKPAAKK